MKNLKCIVLLSGGLDSATTLAMARDSGYAAYAITFSYGQRHDAEVAAAIKIAKRFGAEEHAVVNINLRRFGGSALTSTEIDVPKSRSIEDMSKGIPVTYVPARNTLFLSYALAWAEVLGAKDIFIGVNAVDYSGYPDCRPEYIDAYQTMANLATKAGVEGQEPIEIHTPLIDLTKAEIIAKGIDLNVDYSITVTCYDHKPNGKACGQCDACLLRLKGFSENKIQDPAPYKEPPLTESV